MIVTFTLAIQEQVPIDSLPQMVRAAQQDPRAFSPLYRQFVDQVYRFTYSRIGNQADAEDVTADIFADALNSIGRYRERGHFAAWLFRIARRRIADFHRRHPTQSLDSTPDLAAGLPSLASQVGDRDLQQQLSKAIAALPEAKRELIELRFAAGLPFKEIAKTVGKREAAVKMALRRTLDGISAELEAYRD